VLSQPISKQAYSLLVNISQDDDVSLALVKTPGMIDRLVESIFVRTEPSARTRKAHICPSMRFCEVSQSLDR